jgi:hypothetical protein
MDTLAQLKQIRQQMFDELSRQPQYRAVRAMKRFIEEMTEIYAVGAVEPTAEDVDSANVFGKSVEKRLAEGPTEAVAKRIRAYSP